MAFLPPNQQCQSTEVVFPDKGPSNSCMCVCKCSDIDRMIVVNCELWCAVQYMLLKPTIQVTGGQKIPFHSLAGSVEFKSVKFTYPTRPDHIVLNDFNLEIPAGRIVALVGLSGSGQLLCSVCWFLWLYFLLTFADWEQNCRNCHK